VSQPEARKLFELPPDGQVLLVFGGSLGAALLNDVTVDAFGRQGPPAVLHLSGTRDYDRLVPRVSRPDYRLYAFTEEFGAALGASDLVLARAGGSVWELAAAGKPAVLVPGSFATGDHQAKNARFFEAAGAAIVVPEAEAARAPDVVRSLLADPTKLQQMSDAMLRVARPNAADEIAEELLALAA
jgi:UDP-N-acetylglucosamine--N-acetylmuramyl-(pentapeptide) pyrophosphoryl-undecaprenol N-acetylglucosamine transferase